LHPEEKENCESFIFCLFESQSVVRACFCSNCSSKAVKVLATIFFQQHFPTTTSINDPFYKKKELFAPKDSFTLV